MPKKLTPEEAHIAVLAGKTIRVTVGTDPNDPICLVYMDKCHEDDWEPMIYTESIGGWSEGVKEAICDPTSTFFVEHMANMLNLVVTAQEPFQRETAQS